jgi:Uma2 family endonuclease
LNSLAESPEIREALLPMSVEFFHAATDLGWIDEDVELLEGLPLKKMSKSPEHEYVVRLLFRLLEAVAGPSRFVAKESPLTCADSEPEPDLMVVRGQESDFRHSHPTTADLVIEVALNTLDRDRRKAKIYAAASVSEYWLIDPAAGKITIHRVPGPEGYGESLIVTGADRGESNSVVGFRVSAAEITA